MYDLGIIRVIIIVPGFKGFKQDSTHKKFIDAPFFTELATNRFYRIAKMFYFPINLSYASKIITHNELIVILNKYHENRLC